MLLLMKIAPFVEQEMTLPLIVSFPVHFCLSFAYQKRAVIGIKDRGIQFLWS